MPWKKATTKDGKIYYYNTETKKTQWNLPDELRMIDTSSEVKVQNNNDVTTWKQLKTKDGKVYYYDTLTKKTSWTRPGSDNNQPDSALNKIGNELQDKKKNTSGNDNGKVESIETNPVNHIDPESTNLIDIKKPDNLIDAEKIFMEMLNDYKVDSTWSFSKIINDIGTKDPRYWVVDDDPLWKREMFDKYLDNRTQDQLIKESQEINKFTTAFNQLLEDKNVKYYHTWCQVKRLIRDEAIFKHSMTSNNLKKETFNKYVAKLKQEHDLKFQTAKDQALIELRNYLNNIFAQSHNNWISWNQLLNNYLFDNERFMANKHFKILTHEDILIEYIKIIEKIENDELKMKLDQIMEQNYTRDRIARDNFKKLLSQYDIQVNTTWEEIYDKIKSTKEFINLLGRNGSNAFELFYDLKQEKLNFLMEKVQLVENILSNEIDGFQWNEDNVNQQKDEIEGIIKDNAKRINYPDMTILLDKLVEEQEKKIIERKEFIITEEQRKLSYLIEQELVRSSNITLSEWTWSQMQEKLQTNTEYKSIEKLDNTMMEEVYNNTLANLKSEAEQKSREKVEYSHKAMLVDTRKRTLAETMELDY